MAEYNYSYSGKIAKITESNGLQVRLQEGKVKKCAIWTLYETSEGDWGYRSPKAGGAVAINIPILSSGVVGWLIKELQVVQAMIQKEEQASTKTSKVDKPKVAKADVDFTNVSKSVTNNKVDDSEDLVIEAHKANRRNKK